MPTYVVTGSARGIGLAFVKQLSADSANTVFAIVRNKGTANHLVELSRGNVVVIQADVTDAKALNVAAAEVSKHTGGKLDFLINNVGGSSHLGLTLTEFPTPEALEEDLLYNFKLNAVSVVHTTNAFLPLLKKGEVKKVVTLSSGAADIDFTLAAELAAIPASCMAKAAANLAVAKFAAELKSEGFVFLALSPGMVDVSATNVTEYTETTIADMTKIGKAILKVAPDFKAPISPEESVRLQLEVINRWTVEDTGAFVSQKGNKEWV
ncbi:hypothetical protein C8R46DRAFT_1059686 [Mycena filopes]|nr:hypothetical protein C8R46DRAFT_1059686 [Mycena filopes]